MAAFHPQIDRLPADFFKQPCFGVGSPAFGGGFRDAEDFGSLLDCQSDELTQLDLLGLS
jgi:hypothetical protein